MAENKKLEACEIILELVISGIARFERSKSGFVEFCFNSMRYHFCHKDACYEDLLDQIGWDKARAALHQRPIKKIP